MSEEESQMEKIFLCYRMSEEIVQGHLPMSNELAEELCALYAQVNKKILKNTKNSDLGFKNTNFRLKNPGVKHKSGNFWPKKLTLG